MIINENGDRGKRWAAAQSAGGGGGLDGRTYQVRGGGVASTKPTPDHRMLRRHGRPALSSVDHDGGALVTMISGEGYPRKNGEPGSARGSALVAESMTDQHAHKLADNTDNRMVDEGEAKASAACCAIPDVVAWNEATLIMMKGVVGTRRRRRVVRIN